LASIWIKDQLVAIQESTFSNGRCSCCQLSINCCTVNVLAAVSWIGEGTNGRASEVLVSAVKSLTTTVTCAGMVSTSWVWHANTITATCHSSAEISSRFTSAAGKVGGTITRGSSGGIDVTSSRVLAWVWIAGGCVCGTGWSSVSGSACACWRGIGQTICAIGSVQTWVVDQALVLSELTVGSVEVWCA